MKKIGIVGIVINNREKDSYLVNNILSEHADIIIGRMGIPQRDGSRGFISLFVEGNTDRIGSLTGKLGKIRSVTVKSLLLSLEDKKNE